MRVHDLRHTFGHRLRAAGASFEDRQDLLGQKSDRKATHYSAPALYWYFKNKQVLLDEMAATMLRDLLAEGAFSSAELPWAEWMSQGMQRLRRMLLRYRDGARVFSGTYLADDSLLEGLEAPLRVMTNAGYSGPSRFES